MDATGRAAAAEGVGYVTATEELPHDRDTAMSPLFASHWDRLVRLAALLVDDRESAEDAGGVHLDLRQPGSARTVC
jgi:hypothetical protein